MLLEFGEMAKRVAGTEFSYEELEYVAQSLSDNVRADDMISRDEFRGWIFAKSMTIM